MSPSSLILQHIDISKHSKSYVRKFAYLQDYFDEFPPPWKAAFPEKPRMGYTTSFSRECSRLHSSAIGFVDEGVAKSVWLSILEDYLSYSKLGMWIPEQPLSEHEEVAKALGWLKVSSL